MSMINKNYTTYQVLFLLGVIVLILSACGRGSDNATQSEQPSGTAITVDMLPDGLGRGYTVASLEAIDNSGTGLDDGDVAPNFRMQLDDGQYLDLSDLEGTPVVLNFWATWCGPCRAEMPDLVEQYEHNDELVILAINTQEELKRVQPFVDEFQMSMPVVLDKDGEIKDMYGVRGMPTSVFIGKDGKISNIWAGILTKDLLAEMLSKIL
ncbi:MAG: redoxin domain-containing protein [Chloroflexota bacterium]